MPIPVKKISAYNPKDTIVDNDTMLVTAKGETYNATAKVFMEYVKNHPEMDALFATDAQLESIRGNLASTISAETSRAKSAESTLTSDLNAEISRAKKAESDIQNVIDSNKNNWNDKYTKNEIDNKFSTLENNIDWKESVATFNDIAKTYPTPQDGWTVNVKDTDYTYRYSGSKWVIISANAIPNATQSVDGLLTASDKTNYDDANSKKHTHSNKSVLDGITSALVTAWNKVTDKVDNSADGADSLLSKTKTTWTAIPTDDTYFIRQDTGGTNVFGRVKFSTLWSYIKSKLSTVATSGSYNDLTNKPTSMTANGGNSATVNGHTVNSDVPSGAKFTDTVYTHPTGDGNKHIPANGTTNNGKYLKATGTAGSYQWGNITKNDVINALGYTPGTSSAEPIVYTTGTAEKEGLTKLYTKTGTATDGTMTQAAIKTALNNKANILKYDFNNHNVYRCLGTATLRQAGDYLILHIYYGAGYNANIGQDKTIDVHIRTSNGSAVNGKYYTGYIESHLNGAKDCNVYVVQNSSTSFTIWIGKLQYPGESFYEVQFPSGDSWASATNTSTTIPTNGVALIEKKIAYTDSNIATATALTTSAGSATQPIYFSNGKPVACTYSLGKSVPSNAVFTDTNTWRGIQDNLTSTSTTESLSAKQGKNLKTSVDNKIIKNSSSTAPTTQDNGGIWLKEYT